MDRIVGIVQSPFPEKFGIPRQPGLIANIRGTIIMNEEYSDPAYFKGLETFTHLWILFKFGDSKHGGPTIRPPRLGGKKRVGIFASRSPHRPNPLGMSVVKFEDIIHEDRALLKISGHDLLDGTEVLDIKPYIPEWDIVPDASRGWLQENPQLNELKVKFTLDDCDCFSGQFLEVIEKLISFDPRPVHQYQGEHFSTKTYSMKYDGYDIHWMMESADTAVIFQIDTLE
jgi:tRNA-Thr(GGU) m(6)t(6)A37 methyltransferase TsaA